MQITRLHILILLIGAICAGAAYYFLKHPLSSVPTHTVPQTSIPSIPATPAPHPHNSPAVQAPAATDGENYRVVKGDTLWRIARDHSPVHQGPGWVAIWKTNKSTVKDFDRLEKGWTLTIPAAPEAYITKFWKPRMLVRGTLNTASDDLSVDVAQLPVTPDVLPGTSAWPPAVPQELEVALLQSEPMPRELAVALLTSTPLPNGLAQQLSDIDAETIVVALAPDDAVMPVPPVAWTPNATFATFQRPLPSLMDAPEFH